jgi:2,3-dimethylmalate lyase
MGKTKGSKRLKDLLRRDEFVLVPGCFNALSARLIEQAGFDAIYISGAGTASNYLGLPDIGLMTMTEILENARNIVNVTALPVICDCDTGFGNAINMIRTVRAFEAAGLAGIQVEDQIMPKKCGHTEGKQLVSKEEMVQKIHAAVDTRKDPNFVLIIRTDAIAVNGIEDALDRAKAYEEAGADVIFVEAPRNIDEMKRITSAIHAPLVANMVEHGGKSPILAAQDLKKLGYKMAIYPCSLWMASIKSMQELLLVLKKDGMTNRFASKMVSFQEMFELVDLPGYVSLERKYTTRTG